MAVAGATTHPADRVDDALGEFMRYYLVHVNPVLHRTVFRGRSYSELEIVVTMALHVSGPLRPSGLSRSLSANKGSLTSVIRRLADLGLVVTPAVPGDARGYRVGLTADGEAFVRHLADQRRRQFRALFDAMDPDEAEAAARGLQVMSAYLRRWEAQHVVRDAH